MILKKAILTAGAIVVLQFLIVGLLPSTPPLLVWVCVVLALFACALIAPV